MAARELRYKWFSELAEQKEYRYILTAHHQNDVIETVLLNLIRGTGIAGLHGIRPKSGNLLRPLLYASKEDILLYAKEKKLLWREDNSNQSSKYHRNLLRLEVIPLLKKINPNLENTLSHSIEKISAAEHIFNNYIEGCKIDFFSKKDNHLLLAYDFLQDEAEPLIILYELLKPYKFNYTQAFEILKNLDHEAGKKFISETHLLVKDRTHLIITEKGDEMDTAAICIKKCEHEVFLPWNKTILSFETTIGYKKTEDPLVAYLNYAKLTYPLRVRPWQNGDSFQPFGMKGKKKVSDFLNDLKVPLNLKDQVSVLLSGDDIAWVVGYRIDERFKALEDKRSLKVLLTKNISK